MDNKNTIIAVCIACLLMMFVFACSRGCNTSQKKVIQEPSYTQNYAEKDLEEDFGTEKPKSSSKTSYVHSGSHGHISASLYERNYGTPPPLLTEEDKKRMKERSLEFKRKRDEYAKKWIEEQLNDPSLTGKAREQLLIKSNKTYIHGKIAMKHGNYKEAIKDFNEVIKDEKASPITKYFALNSIMNCAYSTKNLELFFVAARMKANLIKLEDLSAIGIEKNNDYDKWCDKVEYALKVRDNRCSFDDAVYFKMKQENIDKKSAEMAVKEDIDYYSKMFEDFYL